jgi:hypothetical protein
MDEFTAHSGGPYTLDAPERQWVWMNLYTDEARLSALDVVTFERNDIDAAVLESECTICQEKLADASGYAAVFDVATPDLWGYRPYGAFARRLVFRKDLPATDAPQGPMTRLLSW